jgi:glycosyltransferase involved in cell wall biosynthesis
VVRSTLPLWHQEHDIVLAAWTPEQSAIRSLAPAERDRVLNWHTQNPAGGGTPDDPAEDAWDLVIPWNCVVVVPEVPAKGTCAGLAALASSSGNRVVAIGYDCIPVASADLVPPAEPNRFVRYLSAAKHLRRIACISASATAEFQGFAAMLESQGLPGPTVVECALPSPALGKRSAPQPTPLPVVLCVGSYEPRKNQESVLFAAEVLWREGLRFELDFVGGGFPDRGLRRRVRRLTRDGRAVRIRTAITEGELDSAYASARFTVFPSIHEGYGLPVVESLAHGTPVITSEYGSTSEIAKGGGAVVIDPREDLALVDAMRELLRDDHLLTRLHDQLPQRPSRTWAEYAAELWRDLVEPELVSPR